jgi:hypothetical protein
MEHAQHIEQANGPTQRRGEDSDEPRGFTDGGFSANLWLPLWLALIPNKSVAGQPPTSVARRPSE